MQPITLSYTTPLSAAGLTREQAIVYEALIKLPHVPVSTLAKALTHPHTLSRPLIYKVLDELVQLNLIEKTDSPGKVASFAPKHPTGVLSLLEAQKKQLEQAQSQCAPVVESLTSLFNLSSGKPGVQYFEGKDGLWELLLDSLRATEEIVTYADLEAIGRYIPDLNAEYSALREEKQVKKRGLVIDSPEARKFLASYDGAVTTTKLIPSTSKFKPFQTNTQIYDNKISYMTLSDQYLIGLIITDQYIANTHKYLFESLWELASGEVV